MNAFGDGCEELVPGDPRSVARARSVVTAALDGVAVDHDDVLLAASELVTNAVVAASHCVRLRVDVLGGRARIAVFDDGSGVPVALPSTPDLAHGRGLSIVETLALRWGVATEPPGKWVWAEFPVTPAA